MHAPSVQSKQESLDNTVFLIEKLGENESFPAKQLRLGAVVTKFRDVFRWKTCLSI